MNKHTEITLSNGFVAIVDNCDSDLNSIKWEGAKSGRSGEIYAKRETRVLGQRKFIFLYQTIMERILDRPLEKGELVDHKDRNPLNNRRDNLRLADKSKNAANSKLARNNTSGWRGAWKDKKSNRWCAEIGSRENKVKLGFYETAEEAAIAYNHAAIERFGEFASLNDVPNWENTFPVSLKRGDLPRSDSKSGYVRINFLKNINKFRAYSRTGKKVYLGQFDTIDEAKVAQDKYTITGEKSIAHEWKRSR